MRRDVASQPKEKLDTNIVLQNRWVTVKEDHYRSNGGDLLDYWLVERSDSVIVIVRQGGKFVLGDSQMRPGIESRTLDFPGGRIDGANPAEVAKLCVRREFQLNNDISLPEPMPLLAAPLFVDSAFSSQKVYGFVVDMPKDTLLDGMKYSEAELIEQLQCLQCRAMLLEWLRKASGNS